MSSYPPQPFSLPVAKVNELENLADQLVAETLKTSDTFTAQGRVADKSQWKVVRQKNNMTAYKTRGPSRFRASIARDNRDETPQLPKLYSTNDKRLYHALTETFHGSMYLDDDESDDELRDRPSFVSAELNVLENVRPPQATTVFSAGVVPGTIDDIAMGVHAHSDSLNRAMNADLAADDSRILCEMHGPSNEDPFRFLGVTWSSHIATGFAGHFISPRDYVVLDSTGMALDAHGQRFFYLLKHSIEVDQVPDFESYGSTRLKFSVCYVVRQQGDGEVDIFCRGFMEPLGSMSERFSTYMFCDGLMSVPKFVEEAYKKKLTWLRQTLSQSSGNSTGSFSSKTLPTCPCCQEKFRTGLAKLLENKSTCSLCELAVCRKCTVTKTEVAIAKEQAHDEVAFCLNCYLKGKKLSAWQVAIDLLREAEPTTCSGSR